MKKTLSQKDTISKFISFILRHHPETIGITLDEHGWADVDELLNGIKRSGKELNKIELEEIVRTDNKNRYSFNADKTKIRANQGHSIAVDLELKPCIPPEILYHGTADRFLDSIQKQGLKPMSRLYVHLSKEKETAILVGKRHGKPVVLKIYAAKMQEAGESFYLSENGVYLVRQVLPEYLEII